MNQNLICSGHYLDPQIVNVLSGGIKLTFSDRENSLVILCIGTDGHIGDSLGPLVGTMLLEAGWRRPLYGTLASPLHARNLAIELPRIRSRHPGCMEMAIDASLGKTKEIGTIEIRNGGVLPGRALAKRLPMVGEVSVIGRVGARPGLRGQGADSRLGLIYPMARAIVHSLLEWEGPR